MNSPEAVRKHDGRVVAYDLNRLTGSIARAACSASPNITLDNARRLAQEIARAVSTFLVGEGRPVPASADVRAMTLKLLRETNHPHVADAYGEFARAASGLLWRLRVVQPGTPFTSNAGTPWDRRRLLESFRATGVARDPAGEVAREVERRLVALSQERVSPALIHALSAMVLAQRGIEVRVYAAKRVAVPLSVHVPRYDALSAEHPEAMGLPQDGPTLEAFWSQCVHTPEILRALHDNIISLEPYPHSPADDASYIDPSAALDPLLPQLGTALREWCVHARPLWVRADSPERAAELARYLALLPASLTPTPSLAAPLTVLLEAPPPLRNTRLARRALPVTINAPGLMVRETLRDQQRAAICLAKAAALTALAHREREEYFNLSPVRGRQLPVAVAGLWNAVAWLNGGSVDAPHISPLSCAMAESLISVLRSALETLRLETGMELCLIGNAPAQAIRQLWQRDREFFRRDGITLDSNAIYDGGPAIRIAHHTNDLGDRIDFAHAASTGFDEPPGVAVEVPLGEEPDVATWREFLAIFAQAGVSRLNLVPGGGTRNLKTLSRALRTHMEGFPLLDQMQG